MEIVDTHMHLWSPATHPWVLDVKDQGHPAGKFAPILTYDLDRYKKDIEGYNVTHTVHIEACWPGDPVGETKFLEDIAKNDPTGFPTAIVGHVDLCADNVEELIQRHCQSTKIRGIRHMLNYHPTKPIYNAQDHDNFLTDDKWLAGLSLLEKYNLSFDLQILPHQMARSADVAEKFPGIMFMLDHCGTPYEREEDKMAERREGMEKLAKFPNVYCKISGAFFTDPQWNQESFTQCVKPCIEAFGIDRCVFGSNFPVDRINGSLKQMIDALNIVLEPYSDEDKRKLFSENAKKFYRL